MGRIWIDEDGREMRLLEKDPSGERTQIWNESMKAYMCSMKAYMCSMKFRSTR